jgi:hypothetical protein
MFGAGFVLTALACAYAAYNSWGGVRYFTGLVPFAYAYGFSYAPVLAARFVSPRPAWTAWAIGAIGIAVVAAPVANPHRHYERALPRALAASGPYAYRPEVAEHLAKLAAHLPADGHYYAASLCNLNFLAPRGLCVGLQELYDPSWLPRSLAAFHPSLVVLARSEAGDSALGAALDRMRALGYIPVTVDSGSLALYLGLRAEPGRVGPTP